MHTFRLIGSRSFENTRRGFPPLGDIVKSEKYSDFVKKFKPKKTTDDCYTPQIVYDAVAWWVANEYKLDSRSFVRPFWPGGDYKSTEYPAGCVVLDNPPFSILAEIINFYQEKNIKYFLFAPTLTLFSKSAFNYTCLPVGVIITYGNGAEVNTSFVTNLETADIKVRTAPALYKAVENANETNIKGNKRTLPKYEYPMHVLTAAMAYRYCKFGVDYVLKAEDCVQIDALDSQREQGKAIFGKGLLLSERAAAERAAAERWSLSERELDIISRLGTRGS